MTDLSPKTQMDVADFWEKYREEHNIDKNIILMVIDTKTSIGWTVKRVVNVIIDEIIKQREFEGKSALQPEGIEDE